MPRRMVEVEVTPDDTAEVATQALTRLHSLCDGLRDTLQKAIELKKTESNGALSRIALSDSSLSLLELREVNRTVQDAIATLKGRSANANQEVDSADLKLQNLQYEKNYFLREIRHARDYPPDRPMTMLPNRGSRCFHRLRSSLMRMLRRPPS